MAPEIEEHTQQLLLERVAQRAAASGTLRQWSTLDQLLGVRSHFEQVVGDAERQPQQVIPSAVSQPIVQHAVGVLYQDSERNGSASVARAHADAGEDVERLLAELHVLLEQRRVAHRPPPVEQQRQVREDFLRGRSTAQSGREDAGVQAP